MQIQFKSDEFLLEGDVFVPDINSSCPGVVICHPHPQFGGDMLNNVVQTVRNSLIRKRIAVLTFNFRGVGKSEGSYTGGQGEDEDAISALDYLKTIGQVMDMPIGLCGYSFGAGVASRVAMRYSDLSALVLISGVVQPEWANLPSIPKLFLSGDRDEYVSEQDRILLESTLRPPREIVLVEDVDHWWSPGEDILDSQVGNFFGQELSAS
jgi:alpha/beta superfamily hydrolase